MGRGAREGIDLAPPTLYVFAISHYCERARWALDHLGVAYALRHLAPGPHAQRAKELGAPGTSLPILAADGQVVQGSGAILDWAEPRATDPARRLRPPAGQEEACRALERRLDEIGGVHVRRYYYSEAIVDHPDLVQPIFTRDLAPEEREATEKSWGVVRTLMMQAMDLGPEQRQESRRIVEAELDWMDGLLADGRPFLLGDRFSRADVTAASLLAPLALPKEHPTYGTLEVPPLSRADLELWSKRPTVAWVRGVYQRHR